MADHTVATSAPGKVLLTGGYLVLDRAHTGLVFGLDARIHALVRGVSTCNGVVLSEITVRSPQFQDAVWTYGYRLTEGNGGINVTQLRVDADLKLNRNPFIETALSYALSYIAGVSHTLITPTSITILADKDYYSTDFSNASDASAPRFHNFGVPLARAPKTGLGSSAALVTSFIAAVLSYYLPKQSFDLSSNVDRLRLHNLAQAAHCAAQGKVGSGFDIASAVFGSCVYRRFQPSVLTALGEPGEPGFVEKLKAVVEGASGDPTGSWGYEILKDQVKVPAGLRLVLCDVSCGSQTPGMVKKVLAWREQNPDDALELWNNLQEANESLARGLKAMAEDRKSGHVDALKQSFATIRELIRSMSTKSGVPIEPPPQTELIDACQTIPGVIGGVVPGAGGYDAISLLIEDNRQTVDALRELLAGWKFETDPEAQGSSGRVSMLDVREEMEGVRGEDFGIYKGW